MSRFIFAAVLSFMVASGLFADTVILKNGAAFSGKILFQTSDKIRIRITEGDSADNGATIEMDFDRKKIKEIITDAPVKTVETKKETPENQEPPLEAKLQKTVPAVEYLAEKKVAEDKGKETDGEEPKEAVKEKVAEEKKRTDEELFLPEEEDLMLSSFAVLLCSDKEKDRDEAFSKLKAYGKNASQALVDIIGDTSLPIESRAAACNILGGFNDKRTASVLVDVLGGVPQSDWPVYGEAWDALKKISGFKMPYHRRAGIQTRKSEYRRWRAWLTTSRKKPEFSDQLSPRPVNKAALNKNKDNTK